MFKNLSQKNIPLILLNARITKKTFKRWIKFKYFTKSIFEKISIAYPQNLETKNYLNKLNIKKIKILGNLKFTESNDDNFNNLSNKFKLELKNKKIWIASSTHKNEELFCIKTHLELKKNKNLLTIIIPRHIHRLNEIIKEIKNSI